MQSSLRKGGKFPLTKGKNLSWASKKPKQKSNFLFLSIYLLGDDRQSEIYSRKRNPSSYVKHFIDTMIGFLEGEYSYRLSFHVFHAPDSLLVFTNMEQVRKIESID